MNLTEVYVGLGGNIGNTRQVLLEALKLIKAHPRIHNLQTSSFYQTSAVSPIPQRDYINAVCRFHTELDPHTLLQVLQTVETQLGKIAKPKDAPRVLDCDILFYGNRSVSTPELEIPHPRWRQRLFVLAPLAELTKSVPLPGREDPLDLQLELRSLQNDHGQSVTLLMECAS